MTRKSARRRVAPNAPRQVQKQQELSVLAVSVLDPETMRVFDEVLAFSLRTALAIVWPIPDEKAREELSHRLASFPDWPNLYRAARLHVGRPRVPYSDLTMEERHRVAKHMLDAVLAAINVDFETRNDAAN